MVIAITLLAVFALPWALHAQPKTAGGVKRVALISELSGTATIQQQAPAAAASAARFDSLSEGAVLRVGRGSRVLLVLADGKRFALNADARATVRADRLTATSGSIDELPRLPALPPLVALEPKAPTALGGLRVRSTSITGLSPAAGAVRASHTTLRFAPVQGAATYRVEVENEKGRIIFAVETRGTEVLLAAELLEAGAFYYWTVRTVDRAGAQARGSAEFTTLTSDEEKTREDLKRRLDAEGSVSSIALLATIDLHLGLYQEALDGFRAALVQSPDDESLKAALRRLEPVQGSGGL